MQDSPSESVSIPDEVTVELVRLLTSGHFEQFMGLYRETALGIQDDGAVVLAEVVNAGIRNTVPDCEVKLVVSQKTGDKHIIMIQDGSKFFGPSWTVSRQMFVV
ncbi:MAG: hypothetical protein K2Y39_07295 [Candidatus Obscuribacterales bacterium]|nr:hypothetical protein [Candidatus Obscuribacterales bacterium]